MKDVRIYEAHAGKIHKMWHEESQVHTISEFVNLYAEVIPEEERDMSKEDQLISCFHFDKEPNKLHGVPFRFVIKPVSKRGLC